MKLRRTFSVADHLNIPGVKLLAPDGKLHQVGMAFTSTLTKLILIKATPRGAIAALFSFSDQSKLYKLPLEIRAKVVEDYFKFLRFF